jgi:hypothetical protein
MSTKITRPSRIEPATFRLVAQCLNQLRHCVPPPYGEATNIRGQNSRPGDVASRDIVHTCNKPNPASVRGLRLPRKNTSIIYKKFSFQFRARFLPRQVYSFTPKTPSSAKSIQRFSTETQSPHESVRSGHFESEACLYKRLSWGPRGCCYFGKRCPKNNKSYTW